MSKMLAQMNSDPVVKARHAGAGVSSLSCPLHVIVGFLLAAGISVAAAAPPIPASELPGRERDRFTVSPVERFMRPGPYQTPQVIEPTTGPQCDVHKPRRAKPGSARRKIC
jgi:hypothetical protein